LIWAVMIYLIVFPSDMRQRLPLQRLQDAALVAVAASVSFGLYKNGVRLKEVFLEGDRLHIYDFGRKVIVPLHDVEQVSYFSGRGRVRRGREFVWLRFRRPTDFGRRIVFKAPRGESGFLSYTPHPVVLELESLVKEASRSRRAS